MRGVRSRRGVRPAFQTASGRFYVGQCEHLLAGQLRKSLRGKVQLVLTSPPFPLNRKKKYGNKTGNDYRRWFAGLGELFADVIRDDGSIVIEMGNAWTPGRPVQSLLHLESLLGLVNESGSGLRLCQQFICYNPTRLPSPAQWVTRERIRLTDSFTHVWWLAKTDYPKADNRKVLRPYSDSMHKLLERRSYNHGPRPSQHRISKTGFLQNNGGSIAHNFFELDPMSEESLPRLPNAMRSANTTSTDKFLARCREQGITPHPARMPISLANFFISFLTDEGDLVLDPFAGSNTTGFAAETLSRKWTAIEIDPRYCDQVKLRFSEPLQCEIAIAAE